jgi:hypothetical protein
MVTRRRSRTSKHAEVIEMNVSDKVTHVDYPHVIGTIVEKRQVFEGIWFLVRWNNRPSLPGYRGVSLHIPSALKRQ